MAMMAMLIRCAKIVSVLLPLVLAACASLPAVPHLPKSQQLTERVKAQAKTAQTTQITQAQNATLSGYYPITTGADAFAVRSVLAAMATRSIDVQYYIWHNDEAGQLLLKDLWEAAQRGVVVRLLLDDMNSSPDLDQVLYRLAEHPNIAVRLMNPLAHRQWRIASIIKNPLKVNARMHNKSMTIDRQISIIGGRNIGDEYLNQATSTHFADLDVLLVGKVVDEIGESFEEYWNSPLAFDVQAVAHLDNQQLEALIKPIVFEDFLKSNNATPNERALKIYRDAIENTTIGNALLNKTLPFRWTKIELFADPADKLIHPKHNRNQHIVRRLQQRLGQPTQDFSAISSYFVPTKQGVDTLVALAKSGVRVRILTNSFDATDVGIVHSGYAHWRKRLLAAGVQIYEIKSTATNQNADENRFWRTKAHTSTSLHAKAFAVDGAQVFVGSYNIDPRSANINTELGVLIDDAQFAQRFHQALSDEQLLYHTYQLRLADDGTIQWHTIENNQHIYYRAEPKTSLPDRAKIVMSSWLPLDWLL